MQERQAARSLLVAAYLVLAPGVGAAATPETFDIWGVRLYMTPEEVRAALVARFNDASPGIDMTDYRKDDCKGWGGGENFYRQFRSGNAYLTVQFVVETDGKGATKCSAYSVTHQLRQDLIPRDAPDYRAALVRRYGPPSINRENDLAWCQKVEADKGQPTWKVCSEGPSLQVRLQAYEGPQVTLYDQVFVGRVRSRERAKATPKPRTDF